MERNLRERFLYFAAVPAVILALCVLGGLALQTNLRIEQSRQRAMFEVTETLVLERINVINTLLTRQANAASSLIGAGDLETISRRWGALRARETPTVEAFMVVDVSSAEHEVVAFASQFPKPGDDAFRRFILNRYVKTMSAQTSHAELRHIHEEVDGHEVLLSYFQLSVGRRPTVVIVSHDVSRLVADMMPELFPDAERGNSRMNIVDDRGRIVFGSPIKSGELTVGKPMTPTLGNWRLQVALTSVDQIDQEVNRRRIIELSMVVVSSLVALLGLVFLINASLKERRLSSQKSDFVANVSHELKTPLSLIRMFGEMLLSERVGSEEKKKQYLGIIVSESERLTALIENVLDFARVERGQGVYDFAVNDLVAVVSNAIEIVRPRALRESMTVTLKADDSIPDCLCDEQAIELMVINLVDNAIKYAKEGERIEVSVSATKERIEIAVRDFGPGIPKADHGRIFERFYRGESADSTRARGTGIGLSLVRHIAETHGGKVRVESPSPGQKSGTTFRVLLPVRTERKGRSSLFPKAP